VGSCIVWSSDSQTFDVRIHPTQTLSAKFNILGTPQAACVLPRVRVPQVENRWSLALMHSGKRKLVFEN